MVVARSYCSRIVVATAALTPRFSRCGQNLFVIASDVKLCPHPKPPPLRGSSGLHTTSGPGLGEDEHPPTLCYGELYLKDDGCDQQTSTNLFTGQMPFLLHNKQHQSTEVSTLLQFILPVDPAGGGGIPFPEHSNWHSTLKLTSPPLHLPYDY